MHDDNIWSSQWKLGFLLMVILYVSFVSSVQGCEMVSKGFYLQGVCGVDESVYQSEQYCLQKCLFSPLCQAVVITNVPLTPCRVYFCSVFEPVVESFEYFAKECPSQTTALTTTADGVQTTSELSQTSVSETESTPDIGTSSASASEEIQENASGQTAMWREESQARNKVNINKELFSISPLSIAQCCAICTENHRCNSFFYERMSNRCRGHALIYFDTSSSEFTEHLGYLYYTRQY